MSNSYLALVSPIADAGVAHFLDTAVAFTSGKIQSWRTNAVEKASVDFEGTFTGHDGIFGGKATVAETLAVTGITTLSDDLKITATKKIYLDGGNNTYINEPGADQIDFFTGGAERVKITSTQFQISTDAYVGGDLHVAATGPHVIGGGLTDYVRLGLSGNFTSGGASDAAIGTMATGVITGHSGDSGNVAGMWLANSMTINGNAAIVAQLILQEPEITETSGNAAIGATLYIGAAPTEATTNAALYVAAGNIIHAAMATSDPSVAGALWNDSGTVKISAG
jgi:hypothetical protein